jgi:hypothetical protein
MGSAADLMAAVYYLYYSGSHKFYEVLAIKTERASMAIKTTQGQPANGL